MKTTCGDEYCVCESVTLAAEATFAELNAYWNNNEVFPELAGPDKRMIGSDPCVLLLLVPLVVVVDNMKKNFSISSSISPTLSLIKSCSMY